MSTSEPLHYLHPEFDPRKLKMDQIRNILILHHVKTPTGVVKKQQLIDLFEQHIRPQIPDPNQEDDYDERDEKHPSSSKARHSRVKEEQDEDTFDPTPVKIARVKRASSQQSLATEKPAEAKPKVKRSNSRVKASAEKSDSESKTSETTRGRKPRKAIMQSEDESEPLSKPATRVKRETKDKKKKSDNFSDENPFQSGSESERKRSRSRSRTPRKPKDSDSKTSSTRDHVFKVPAEPAFSKFMHRPQVDNKVDESSSSLSTIPTTTATMAHSKSRRMSTEDLPEPKHLHLSSTQPDMQEFIKSVRRNVAPISLLISAVLLAYGIWLRQTRIDIGFCTEAELEAPTPRPWYYPSCIPCPDHAICLISDAEPICPPEYMLKPQLLSFGNLFPITPVCVLNRAKEYRSLQVADATEKLLHIHAGNIECSFGRDKAPRNSVEYKARRGLSLEELRFQVEQLKDNNVSDEDFAQYWDLAVIQLQKRSDKIVFEKGLAGEERLRSLKPQKSLGCRLRQALLRWIIKFKGALFAMFASVLGGFAIHAHVLRRRKENRIVNGLVHNVLSKLSDQAHYYYVDPAVYPDPFLPQTHLRDALLADVHSTTRRQEIWEKVQAVVERNSNVRVSSQEVRGELHRVWEWVGASGVLGQHAKGASGVGAGEGSSHHGHSHSGNHHHEPEILGGTRARGTPKVPPRVGPHGSFFGMRRQDSEYMNPENALYPSISQEYDAYSQE